MSPSDDPAFEALDAAQQFARLGIPLPDTATHWVTRITELQRTRPEAPPHNHVAELIAAAADESDITAAMTRHLNHHLRAGQHALAEAIGGRRALDAILDDRARMHTDLAAIADQLIDTLHTAAAIETTADVTTEAVRELVQQNRTDEARVLAVVDTDADQLKALYDLRDLYLTPPTEHWPTGLWDCAAFSNPWKLRNLGVGTGGSESLWTIWRRAIRAGGRLWFPTVERAQAETVAQEPTAGKAIDPARGAFV